ncbi:MAG: WecB/TagA/CpsF family glycosyltransferase [Prevotellaceae bacterium]|jgi:N-acetylglucosaminyldiphosphoundecaprenol N-acetyl-beta-D-mannosaminyltransferase|nr:WecB/TagA/CpsF family glycosyltransferase [Prevotellaceae bacterium]
MQKHKFISIDLSLGSYGGFIDEIIRLANRDKRSEYICIANVHMLVETYWDKKFADAVNRSIITTPDGVPLTWGLKWLYRIRQERVSGMDLLPDLLHIASQQSFPVFFYGGTQETLDKTKDHVTQLYSGIPSVGICSPPFRPLTSEEEQEVISIINTSGARIVFVSLGCPKQEKWMISMKDKINSVMIGIGAALPVLTGVQKRAPRWMQKNGLEWLFRLIQEPQRLWKRYLVTNVCFLYLLIKEKIGIFFYKIGECNRYLRF